MSDWAKHVLPHGPLEPLAPRLWRVRGTLPSFPLPREMIVWRDDAGDLLLHSVVAVDEPTVDALLALGAPRTMVVPSTMHRLDAGVYKARWPALQVVCPAAVRAKVQAAVPVDASAEDALPALGATVLVPDGTKPVELVYEVEAGDGSRALLFNDQVFHVAHLPGLQGFVMRYLTRSTGFFGITGLGRWMLMTDRQALAAWLRAQADRGEVGVITMSHGEPILGRGACAAALRAAAARLT